jgi:hypothetical protein
MIKAILIDPETRTIREVLVDEKDFLDSCYKLIGCNLIEVAVDLDDDTIYVDEEGLCKQVKGLFEVVGAHQPFAGRGLVVGYNASADKHVDTTLSVQDVVDIVRWVC